MSAGVMGGGARATRVSLSARAFSAGKLGYIRFVHLVGGTAGTTGALQVPDPA